MATRSPHLSSYNPQPTHDCSPLLTLAIDLKFHLLHKVTPDQPRIQDPLPLRTLYHWVLSTNFVNHLTVTLTFGEVFLLSSQFNCFLLGLGTVPYSSLS